MFILFFFLLRKRGLKVSINEWMTLMEAFEKGLCQPSLTDFYRLSRSILVKSETEYDVFDQVFAEYFKDVEFQEEIPDEIWKWLDEELGEVEINQLYEAGFDKHDLEKLQKMFKERMAEQKEKHCGGNYWIGTGGTSVFGHSGYNPSGIRVGGQSRNKSAVQIAGERKFRDFREDNMLDTRQFQVALKKLRQYSSRVDAQKTELDIDETIQKTSDNAGLLNLVWQKPRQNTIKLLLLFDSDGSMMPYTRLCSHLFQAVSKSNHFKDMKIYYFHNCIYEHLYTDPYCRRGHWVDTEWVFNNLSPEYKVIIIGDGTMSPTELMNKGGNVYVGLYNDVPGIEWLKRVYRNYENTIWLNPIPKDDWDYVYGQYTLKAIADVIPMFELSIHGLEEGIKKLINKRG